MFFGLSFVLVYVRVVAVFLVVEALLLLGGACKGSLSVKKEAAARKGRRSMSL